MTKVQIPEHPGSRSLSPTRMLVFGGVIVGLAFTFISLPAGINLVLFALVLAGALVIGWRGEQIRFADWPRPSRAQARNLLLAVGAFVLALGPVPVAWRPVAGLVGLVVALAWATRSPQALALWPASMRRVALSAGRAFLVLRRPWIGQISLGLALGLAVLAMVRFNPEAHYADAVQGFVPLVFSLAAAGIAHWCLARPDDKTTPVDSGAGVAIRWRWVLAGCLAWMIIMQANLLQSADRTGFSHHLQMIFMLAGTGALVAGLAGGRGPLRWRWTSEHGIVVLVFGAALLLRLWNLEYGVHRFVDELHFADAIARLFDVHDRPLIMPHGGTTVFAWVYPYWQGLVSGLTGPSLTGLRLLSAIMGAVQIATAYALVRGFARRDVALIAALTLASFAPHLHFSRIGLNNIGDPTFGLLGLTWLFYGLRSGRQIYFALAGASLGWTVYFYEGGRLFYIPFTLLWLGWVGLAAWRDGCWRWPGWRHLLIFGIGIVVIAGAFYYVWTGNRVPLLPRYDAVGGNLQGVLNTLWGSPVPLVSTWGFFQRPLMAILYMTSLDSFFNAPYAYILPWVGPLFILGMGHCLARIRQPGPSLLFWWVIATCGANMVMGYHPQSPRFVVGYPAIGLVCGLGLGYTWQLLGQAIPRLGRWRGGLAVLGGVLVVSQVAYFFYDFQPQYYMRQFYREYDRGVRVLDFDDAMLRVVQLPPNAQANLISPGFWGASGYGAVLSYYGRHRDIALQLVRPDDLTETYLLNLYPSRVQAFFIEPDNAEAVTLIRDYFDLEGPYMSPFDIPPERQFALYIAYPSERSLNDVRRWQRP